MFVCLCLSGHSIFPSQLHARKTFNLNYCWMRLIECTFQLLYTFCCCSGLRTLSTFFSWRICLNQAFDKKGKSGTMECLWMNGIWIFNRWNSIDEDRRSGSLFSLLGQYIRFLPGFWKYNCKHPLSCKGTTNEPRLWQTFTSTLSVISVGPLIFIIITLNGGEVHCDYVIASLCRPGDFALLTVLSIYWEAVNNEVMIKVRMRVNWTGECSLDDARTNTNWVS